MLKRLIEDFETPALAHCKSGADRAGMFAVLYCHFRLGQPIEEAKAQLHWTYGHFRSAKTGILDHFFESYLRYRDRCAKLNSSATEPPSLTGLTLNTIEILWNENSNREGSLISGLIGS